MTNSTVKIKGVPVSEFHTTEEESTLNELYRTHTRGNGTFLLINLARRPFNKTLSNVLLASKHHLLVTG